MKSKLLSALFIVTTLSTSGCGSSQATLADIVTTLGNTIAAVETIEGNATLATKITADTQAAQAAVLAWKAGTPTQDVVQALNLVVADLNLLPVDVSPTDAALIALAVSTVEELLTDFGQTTATPAAAALSRGALMLTTPTPPTPAHLRSIASNFKATRARIVAADPTRVTVLK